MRGRCTLGWALVLLLVGCGADGGIDVPVDEDSGGGAGGMAAPDLGAPDVGRFDATMDDAAPALDGAAPAPDQGSPPPTRTVDVLTVNLVTGLTEPAAYARRVRDRAYEAHLATRLQALAPDVVFVQGVLPQSVCEALDEQDPARTCFQPELRGAQIRRLLGDAYSVACDPRQQTTCLGVRTDAGAMVGVELGGLTTAAFETPPLPLPACNVAAGTCGPDFCDRESAVSAVNATLRGEPARLVLVNANPDGVDMAGMAYSGASCRGVQVQQAFELAGVGAALLGGSWGFDPAAGGVTTDHATWRAEVEQGRFEAPALEGSTRRDLDVQLDRVVGDAAGGICEVLDAAALDAGFDFSNIGGEDAPGRLLHRAVRCAMPW